MPKLWTKDFTIITIGTMISMFGNAIASFALGLLVLDYIGSTSMYALYMVCYTVPQVIVPLLVGPYMDRFSRRRTIYIMDFISASIYALIGLMLTWQVMNTPLMFVGCIVIGSVNSVYIVAYESYYPTIVPKGAFTKAYSVSSLIHPLAATIMAPIAGICYNTVGLIPLFFGMGATFFVAACFETQLSEGEQHLAEGPVRRFSLRAYAADLKEGIAYLNQERGLRTITLYFFCTMIACGVDQTLTLPYFRHADLDVSGGVMGWLTGLVDDPEGLGVTVYSILTAISSIGRITGGLVHYRFRYPTGKKFIIAVCVYCFVCIVNGTYLFMPVLLMVIVRFMEGMLAVTSYNIRLSSTQNYVPNAKRGRFNGIFQMANMLGTIIGQLIAGALSPFMGERAIMLGIYALNLIAVFLVMVRGREGVKRIYNCQA